MITAVYVWQREPSDSNLRANRVSYAGGNEVVIHGQGMDLTPQNNFVKLKCYTTYEGASESTLVYNGVGSELSHENKLNSNMGRGQLQYTLPSLDKLAIPTNL